MIAALPRHRLRREFHPIGIAIVAILGLAGCGERHPPSEKSAPTVVVPPGSAPRQAAAADAAQILARMIQRYQAATTYRDAAVVRLDLKTPAGDQHQEFPIDVTFARPHRLRFTRHDVLVLSDGEKLYGKVLSLADQVVVAAAPEKIAIPAFYEIQAISPLMQPGLEGHSIQLDLLAADQPLQELRQGNVPTRVLPPAVCADRPCDRLSFQIDEDQLVLWIDQENSLLRRLEFPTEELRKSLGPEVSDVTLVAEFRNASLDAELDAETFTWQPSENEIQVRYFVSPPDPRLAPHPLLGQPLPPLTITTPAGATQPLADRQGKVTVLNFWATWCTYCLEAMPQFAAARQKYADQADVEFLAVSLDTPDVRDDAVAARLAEAGRQLPWARVADKDPLQTALAALQLRGIPAYAILDRQGRVQFLHEGADLEADTRLPELVDQILAGKNLTDEARQQWDRLQQQYAEELQRARVEEGTQVIEIQRAAVAPRQEPQEFAVTELWRNREVEQPGNLLATTSPEGQPQVLVIDGLHQLVQLDAQGHIAARHDKLLPPQAAISFLRSAPSADGMPIYVAGGVGMPQFFLFDHTWKRLLEYPPADTAQVYDVLPVDLDGDGTLELCVGYFNEAGVHAVTLDGQRLWRNRSVSRVSDLEATPPSPEGTRNLLCAHSFGSLERIDSQGQSVGPIGIVNRAVTHVAVADRADADRTPIAAITIDPSGRRSLVGINWEGQLKWQYLLPPGEHENPIEMLAYGELIPDQPGSWLVATADGAVHIVAADGQPADRFATGETLFGFAVARFDNQSVLLTSSDQGVTAYAVKKREPSDP